MAAEINIKGIFSAKNKTAAEWTSENPILRDGEFGHEKDTRKSKVGDGVTAWNNLPYQAGDPPSMTPVVGTDSKADFLGTNATVPDVLQKVIAATAIGKIRMICFGGLQCMLWYVEDTRTIGVLGFLADSNGLVYGGVDDGAFSADLFSSTDEEIAIAVINTCPGIGLDAIPAKNIATDSSRQFVSAGEKAAWTGKANSNLDNVNLSKVMSANGYYKAPDGLMFQWGEKSGSSSGVNTVYYPTIFYTEPPIVIANPVSSETSYNGSISCFITAKKTSYFTAILNWKEGSGQGRSGWPFYWLALGRWK